MTGATIRMKSCQVLKMVYIIIIKILKNQPYKTVGGTNMKMPPVLPSGTHFPEKH